MIEVWVEGYAATGNEAKASRMGIVCGAADFRAACDVLLDGNRYYDSTTLTYWGCGLHNNEADARKAHG